MEFSNSYELLSELRSKNLLVNKPKHWWPNFGTFEVVVGAVLTQNTKWENVQKALDKWKAENGEWRVEDVATLDPIYLADIIRSVGFSIKNQKGL